MIYLKFEISPPFSDFIMAVLGEKAKQIYREIVRNLWAYQSGFQKHHDLNAFDASKVALDAPKRNVFPFRAVYPATAPALRLSLATSFPLKGRVFFFSLLPTEPFDTAIPDPTFFVKTQILT